MKVHILIGAVLIGAMAKALAVELPECNLDGVMVAPRFLERLRPTADAGTYLNVAGKLRNGENLAFAKDDPVIVADIKVTSTQQALFPITDVSFKSSWVMSPGLSLPAQTQLVVQGELTLNDGRHFRYVQTRQRLGLVVDDQGRICNKMLNAVSPPPTWSLGTLSQQPADAAFEVRGIEETTSEGGVRVIFNGVGGGQMGFQEVWVNGATVVASIAHNFDQFAKTIKVGPFTFDIIEVSGGKVTLRYEIAERAPVSGAEARKWPMRAVRR